MVTIKDIAIKANVSTATVSRALRNVGYNKPETLEKVCRIAKEMGYIPNFGAQQIKGAQQTTVGIIVSDVNNEYYYGVLASLQRELAKNNISLILMFSSENPEDEKSSFLTLISSGVKAIIFTPTCNSNKEIINTAQKNGINVIQLFRRIYDDISYITNDDEFGCILASKYLIKENCKNILLIDVMYEHIDFNLVYPNRSVGFIKTNFGDVKNNISHLPLTGFKQDEFDNLVEKYKPDGIICATINIGLSALKYIKNKKKNIKLVSFDDNEWLELNKVPSIKQDGEALVKEILDSIIGRKTKAIIIKPELIVR